MTGLQPWSAHRKLKLIADGGGNGLGLDWWRKAAQEGCDRIAELEAQLPEGMKHCTIQFKECPVGHGALTATNWVQHECFVCRVAELEAEVERLRLWVRRIDNINGDPAHFSKEIDQACIDALAGEPMVGPINAGG